MINYFAIFSTSEGGCGDWNSFHKSLMHVVATFLNGQFNLDSAQAKTKVWVQHQLNLDSVTSGSPTHAEDTHMKARSPSTPNPCSFCLCLTWGWMQWTRGHVGLALHGTLDRHPAEECSACMAWRLLRSFHFCHLSDWKSEPNAGSCGKHSHNCWVIASTEGTVTRSNLATGFSPKGSPKGLWASTQGASQTVSIDHHGHCSWCNWMGRGDG